MAGDRKRQTASDNEAGDDRRRPVGGTLSDRSADQSDNAEDRALKKRLEALSDNLSRVDGRPRESDIEDDGDARAHAMSTGARVMAEFVAAIAVGGFIGWQVDDRTGISPVGMILFLGLGLAAGFWNLYRISKQQSDPSK